MRLTDKHIRLARYVLLFLIVFIAYNTLIPFRPFTSIHKIIREMHNIEFVPFFRDGRFVGVTDILGNILLFLPVGFFARIVFANNAKSTRRSILLGFTLSLCIEFVQIFLHYRIASIHDLITNTLGAWGGAVTATLFLKHYYRHFTIQIRYILRSPLNGLLAFVAAMYFFVFLWISLLVPRHTSTDSGEFLSWENILPALLFSIVVLGFWDERPRSLWHKKTFKMFSSLYVLLLLAALFYNPNLLFWIVLFTLSTYLLFRLIKLRETTRLKIGVLLLLVYIFLDNFQPFVFHSMPGCRALAKSLIPFYHYYKVTSIWAINDLLKMIVEGFWLGIIVEYISKGRLSIFFVMGILFCISISMEITQVFIKGRTADITDIIMFSLGALISVFTSEYRRSGQQTNNQVEQGG